VIAANPGIAKTLLATAAAAAVGAMLLVGAEVGGFGLILAAAGGSVVGVSVAETVARGHAGTKTGPTRRSPGTTGPLAHLGLGVLVVGIAGTLGASTETVVILTDQQARTSIGTLHHGGIELRDGPGTLEAVATVDLITGTDGDGASGKVRRFEPMLISYLGSGASSAEVDTGRGLLTDVQVTLIDGDADRATYRVSRQPGMTLVWTGSALLVLGLAWAAGRSAVPATPLIGQDLVKG
jgi:cytochrome c biogenesis factor